MFEAWFGCRPNLSLLRRFGCDAYLHLPDAQRTKLKPKARLRMFLGYVRKTTNRWRLWDGRHQRIVISSNNKFDESGFGNRQYEDPNILDEISEDHTDQLSLPASLTNRTTVEIPPGDSATSPQMPAANTLDDGNHSQPAEEAPESESPLTSLFPSPHPSPPVQYLDPITPASPRSEAGYVDTIKLAPPPGVNIASSKPANAGIPVQVGNKISRAFSARTDNELQSYKEAMADST